MQPRLLGGINPPASSIVGVATFVGVLVGFWLSTLGHGANFEFRQLLPAQTTLSEQVIWLNETGQDLAQSSLSASELELKYLTDMIANTNGFYARDYSLWLGWNNMRYIIEAAVLHGRILNRTTILPSFVYARACEFDLATCAAYATMVNRGDALHSDEWRELPVEQQMGWRIPISLMFNITHLQQSHSVITTSDYLRLHNISMDVESTDGHWDVDTYHVRDTTGGTWPNLYIIENGWYDPGSITRVDLIPQDMRVRGGWYSDGGNAAVGQKGSWTKMMTNSSLFHALTDALPEGRPVLHWDDVQRIVTDGERITSQSTEGEIADVLRENGFELVYTYEGAAGLDAVKDVVSPICEAVPRHQIRGLYEDFHNISARVLLLHGEVHNGRKPGAMYFTTNANQMRFARTVLYDIRLVESILSLSERLDERMLAMNEGRLWMAAHMRRGDFARYGWAMEADFEAHLTRIQRHLREGRQVLVSMHGGNATVYKVPGAHPDTSAVTRNPPNPEDRYYIATDERDPVNLDYLRDQGAVLITDLLTQEDHRAVGWPILVTDVLALVEQATLARAAYFYAHAFSSVAGGVMNLRAGLGKDPRTAFLD